MQIACNSDGFLAVVGRNVPGQSVTPALGDHVSAFVSCPIPMEPLRRTLRRPTATTTAATTAWDPSDHQNLRSRAVPTEPRSRAAARGCAGLRGRPQAREFPAQALAAPISGTWLPSRAGLVRDGWLASFFLPSALIYFHSLPTSTLCAFPTIFFFESLLVNCLSTYILLPKPDTKKPKSTLASQVHVCAGAI